MASLVNKVKLWLKSPKGQQARSRAQQAARDPRNQAKARGLMQRFSKRRH